LGILIHAKFKTGTRNDIEYNSC